MKQKALVALEKHGQADQALSCLKEVVKPGMTVIFLLPYPVEVWPYLRDHWVEAETAIAAISAGRKIRDLYSWDIQSALAEQKLSAARETLREKEVAVEIQLYTGNLRSTLRDHVARGDVCWIMKSAQTADRLRGLLAAGLAPFGWFKYTKTPVWLLQPVVAYE